MSAVKQCGNAFVNQGKPGCVPIYQVARRYIYTPRFADDGSENKLDTTAVWDKAFFDALMTNSDRSKRIFPGQKLDNVQDTRNTPVFEAAPSGSNFFVQDGTKPVIAEYWRADPGLVGKLNSMSDQAVYIVDLSGNLVGDKSEDKYLKPIPVDSETFRAIWMPATDTTVQKVQIGFDWSRSFCDDNLGIVSANSFATGFNILDYKGLIELVPQEVSPQSDVLIDFRLDVCVSEVKPTIPAKGIVVGELIVTNETTGANIIPVSLVEAPDGQYALTLPVAPSLPGEIVSVDITSQVYDLSTPFEYVSL